MGEREGLAAELTAERERRRAAGLERELPDLRATGADFSSNDTLGLARAPALVRAARTALEQHGAGGRASRLLGGGAPLDRDVERAVAGWLGAEDALLFPSGYHANLGVIGALAEPGDVLLCDELNHASLIDAARLSRARTLIYRHADAEQLEQRLAQVRGARRVLVVTEGVFSMDGDLAPLGALGDACARHGASLIVDEAHACGVLGPAGAGAWAQLGPSRARDAVLAARVVTGGKALGAVGGLVVGSAELRAHVLNRARTFAFSTAAPPAVAGALLAAVAAARSADEAREHARELARRLARSLDLPEPSACIVPVVIGEPDAALRAAEWLRGEGLDVRAVRPPTVPHGTSRLRVVCHAYNTDAELERLIAGLRPMLARRAAPPAAVAPARATPLVVCGTDTDVGKTVVSALLLRAAARLGAAGYWKPVQTGEECDTTAVADLAAKTPARTFAPAQRFELPASPHEAALAAGSEVDVDGIERALAAHRSDLGSGILVVEPAGGLLVPWTIEFTQLDWLARARPGLVLVARSGLGTLNHTLLSFEALRARHLEPRALFLVGPPHESNRESLRRLAGPAALYELPPLEPLDGPSLDAWIDAHDLAPVFAGTGRRARP